MLEAFKDLYVIAYAFAVRLDPVDGEARAPLYAKQICVMMVFLMVVLAVEIVTCAVEIPVSALIGRQRLVVIALTAGFLILGNFLASGIIKNVPDLRSTDVVLKRYSQLSSKRKVLILSLAFGHLVALMLIVAVRQFFGMFGGM